MTKKKGLRSYLITIGGAVVVFVLVAAFLGGLRSTTEVVVARASIPAGARLVEGYLELREVQRGAAARRGARPVEDEQTGEAVPVLQGKVRGHAELAKAVKAAKYDAEFAYFHRNGLAWAYYDTDHAVFRPRCMTPEQLESGHKRAYRDFLTYASILRRSLGLPGTAKRLAYNIAWMKIDWARFLRNSSISL